MARNLPITEFDTLTLGESMQMFKAMIPFLDYNLQKSLSMLIRINELQQTMQFYQNPDNCNSFSCCSSGNMIQPGCSLNDLLSNEQLVNTVLQYCPEKYASMLQSFQQFSKMSDIMNMFSGGSDTFNSDPSDLFQKFAGFTGNFNNNSSPENDLFHFQSGAQAAQNTANHTQQYTESTNNNDTFEQEPVNPSASNIKEQAMNQAFQYASYHLNHDNKNNNHSERSGVNHNSYYDNHDMNCNSNTSKSAPTDSSTAFSGFSPENMFSSAMNSQQKSLYEKYMSELDQIDFDQNDPDKKI